MRGMLNAMCDISENAGLIVSYLFGNWLNSLEQAKICLIVPIILVALLFIYPESPEYLIRNRNHRVCT